MEPENLLLAVTSDEVENLVPITPIFVDRQIMPLIEDAYVGIKDMEDFYVLHPEILPSPIGYIRFEEPIDFILNKDDIKTVCNINSLLYVTDGKSLEIIFFQTLHDAGFRTELDGKEIKIPDGQITFDHPSMSMSWEFGQVISNNFDVSVLQRGSTSTEVEKKVDHTGHNFSDVLAKLVALFEFTNKNIVETKTIQPTTKELKTKRFKKLGKELKTIPDIQVIRLRKKSVEYAYVQERRKTLRLRERDFSWVVRGHMRKQWFSSLEEHKPVWIAPHIKGNVNMPLQNSQKMFVVDR